MPFMLLWKGTINSWKYNHLLAPLNYSRQQICLKSSVYQFKMYSHPEIW